MEGSNSPDSNPKLEELRALWDEYEYRHALIWRVIFQLTAAIVILAVIPYVNPDVVKILEWRILFVPFLSIVLIIFSFVLIWNEMKLFHKIKEEYRQRQKDLFKIEHPDGWLSFRGLVTIFFIVIFLLSVANFLVIEYLWIPFHTKG